MCGGIFGGGSKKPAPFWEFQNRRYNGPVTYGQAGMTGVAQTHRDQAVNDYRNKVTSQYDNDLRGDYESELSKLNELLTNTRMDGGEYAAMRRQKLQDSYNATRNDSGARNNAVNSAVSGYQSRINGIGQGNIDSRYATRYDSKMSNAGMTSRYDVDQAGLGQALKAQLAAKQTDLANIDFAFEGLDAGDMAPDTAYKAQALTPYSGNKDEKLAAGGAGSVATLFQAGGGGQQDNKRRRSVGARSNMGSSRVVG